MNRRRKKFIRADLQLKIVFIALFVANLVLLLNFEMNLTVIREVLNQSWAGVEGAIEEIRHGVVMRFLIAIGVGVILSFCAGILYSFKFSGPIYRFKMYFSELVAGRWDRPCNLRTGDDLMDVCDSINSGVGAVLDRVRENHSILDEVTKVLREVSYTVDGSGKARIQALQERIERESRVWQERFPTPAPTPSVPAPVKEQVGTPS